MALTAEALKAFAQEVKKWRNDAVYAARKLFNFEPDPAQEEFLRAFNPNNPLRRIALKACVGPGKTAVLAVGCWIFMASRPFPKIAATSISWDNLQDNLWTEMAKWQQRSPYLMQKFEWQKTRIFAREHPERWWMSARSWSKTADKEKLGLTLSGLHEDYTAAVIDESGGVPKEVTNRAEATMATVGGEHWLLQAGNPTHLEGPLYDACTSERHLWCLIEVTGDPDDPKRSPRISLQWAKEQIEKYGRDNPWVMVNVLGKFPPSSINTLLGPDDVHAAMQRYYDPASFALQPKILGIDVGRFGGARSVIFPRQGKQALVPVVLRPNRSEPDWTGKFSARIVQAHNKWNPDAIFIDGSGGWAGGVVDGCRVGGVDMIEVFVGTKGVDARYKNRRAEVLFNAAEWVKQGGALPNMPELVREATATTYTFRGGVFVVEEKEQVMEKLGGESPDLWDAFCLTHAQEVAPRRGPMGNQQQGRAATEREEE